MFRTKKLKSNFAVLLILFLVTLFSPLKNVKAVEQTYDQGCTPSMVANIKIVGHSSIYQTFIPTQNRLTRLGVHLKSDGSEPGISFRIITMANQTLAGSNIVTVPNTGGSYWIIYFDYNNVELTPGTMYKIVPSTSNPNVYWHRSADASCNSGGYAYLDGAKMTWDFGFDTFGWTYTPPQEPSGSLPSQTNNEQSGIDTTKNVGAKPSQNISAAIKAPTDVKAVNASTKDKVQVKASWTKSVTTDIDGYKVFRKGKGNDYGQIAQVEKTVTEFIDTSVTEGVQYTYMVRAYKGNSESENSNEATVIPQKKVKKIYSLPSLSELENINWTDWPFLIFYAAAVTATLGLVLWYLIKRRKEKETREK